MGEKFNFELRIGELLVGGCNLFSESSEGVIELSHGVLTIHYISGQ